MKGGKKGGREKKGRGKKTEGERGLSDILVIHFIIHINHQVYFAWRRAQGLACYTSHIFNLLSQNHISQGNVSRRDGRNVSSSKTCIISI